MSELGEYGHLSAAFTARIREEAPIFVLLYATHTVFAMPVEPPFVDMGSKASGDAANWRLPLWLAHRRNRMSGPLARLLGVFTKHGWSPLLPTWPISTPDIYCPCSSPSILQLKHQAQAF
jgi:hypothetical protein